MANKPKPLARLGPDLRKFAKEVNHPDPEPIHKELVDWQATIQIASERNLGPSLKNMGDADHVFEAYENADGIRVRFGTKVHYARFHNAYRRKRGMGNFMAIPDHLVKIILANITQDAWDKSLGGP